MHGWRKERQDALQETRLALSHLEDHIRRLNEKGKELMALLDQIKAQCSFIDFDGWQSPA